jgi:soluble lytic murein transglycosylase-like protein
MNDLQRHRWVALLAGVLLLLGTAMLERMGAFSAVDHVGGALATRAASDSAVRQGVVAALAAKAPGVAPLLSERIAASIARCAREQALAPDLVLAVLMNESGARPGAHSAKGAIGLMQVMPHMYEVLALPGSAAHVEANIEAGCRLLADNIRRLGEERGISSYCWGNSIGNDFYLRRIKQLRRELRPFLDGIGVIGSSGPVSG